MEMHVAALFNHDEAGRITGTNDGDPPGIAPRLYLGRTREGNLWRFRDDIPDELVAELTGVLEAEPKSIDLQQPPVTFALLHSCLAKFGTEESLDMGPAFRFPREMRETAGVIKIDLTNIELVRERFPCHYPWLADELDIRQPIIAIVRNGSAVSICYSARMTPEAAEAGVDTASDFRGQGFAMSVVSVWAKAVRALGRVPLYSTSWGNTASQRVASKLGLVMYGADLSIH